jgi:quercetin dioxygenase-like cupin family protein
MLKQFLIAVAFAGLACLPAAAGETPKSKVTLLFDHPLPNVPGKSMRAVLVEYPPGGASGAHTHPKSAFIYATVLEGSVTSQVNDGPVTAYAAGQSFIEMPGDHHAVSRNTSATEPARLLAVFVVDTADKKLVTEDAH